MRRFALLDRFLEAIGYVAAETAVAATPAPDLRQAQLREAYGLTVDKDEDNWRPLTGDTLRDLSPVTQARMRKMAVYLWESNPLANRLIELPVAYLLAEGVRLTCKDDDSQDLLDRFWKDPINSMNLKLPKKVRELSLYGEQCYPTFVNELDGFVRLGYLDPALIETIVMDPDNPEQPIGIVTCKNKKGLARRYRVIVNGPEDMFTTRTQAIRQTFTDGEAFYFKVNDLSNGYRGRSDLLSQIDWVDAYDDFLYGELDRWKFMRAFIWDVTLTGATEADVKKRAKEITTPSPGSVRVHNDSEKWTAEAPDLQATQSSEAARLFRNHVLGGGTVPEHWFGGGGDVNRAAAAEMGEPTFKIFTMRQLMVKFMLEEIGTYVLRQAAIAGNKDAQFDPSAEENVVAAEFPEMTARDTTAYALAFQQLVVGVMSAIDRGLVTELTGVRLLGAIAQRLGLKIDAEKELENARLEAATRQAKDAAIPDLPEGPDSADPVSTDPSNAPEGGTRQAIKEATEIAHEGMCSLLREATELVRAAAPPPPATTLAPVVPLKETGAATPPPEPQKLELAITHVVKQEPSTTRVRGPGGAEFTVEKG
jgi:hypothetical protein